MNVNDIINHQSYPINRPELAHATKVIDKAREELKEQGLTVLPQFLSAQTLAQVISWCHEQQDQSFHQTIEGNAYLCARDPELPDDHALNTAELTSLAVLAYDQFPVNNPLRLLYQDQHFLNFIAAILGLEKVYHYDCPLGAINISLMKEGDYLRWHFDQSDFVVSIPLQDAEEGGKYQYVRNLRSDQNPNYEEVKRIVGADHGDYEVLNTPPGSLVIFEGRYTLHRVTTIEGRKVRLVALFGLADRPHVTSTDYLRQIRYGRTS